MTANTRNFIILTLLYSIFFRLFFNVIYLCIRLHLCTNYLELTFINNNIDNWQSFFVYLEASEPK